MARKKHYPFRLIASVYLIDPDGKSELVWEHDDPFVYQMVGLFYTYWTATVLSLPLTGGGSGNTSANQAWLVNAAAGGITYGIVAGYGTTAYAQNQSALVNIFAQGSGINQLYYAACAVSAPMLIGSNDSLKVGRTVTNLYTSSQTIYEIGLYTYVGTYSYMLARDVNAGGIATIPAYTAPAHPYSVDIVYTIQTTV